jgi:hypothetical protein
MAMQFRVVVDIEGASPEDLKIGFEFSDEEGSGVEFYCNHDLPEDVSEKLGALALDFLNNIGDLVLAKLHQGKQQNGEEDHEGSTVDEGRRSGAEGDGAREDGDGHDRPKAQAHVQRDAAEGGLPRCEIGRDSAEEKSITALASKERRQGRVVGRCSMTRQKFVNERRSELGSWWRRWGRTAGAAADTGINEKRGRRLLLRF